MPRGRGVGPWSNVAPAARALAALAACATCGSAVQALEPEGYLRVGSGDFGTRDRTCYNLGISGGHYRLGNECDFYGEVGLSHDGEIEGMRWRALGMVNYQRPASDGSASSGGVEQLYVEGRGFAFAPDVVLWFGQRFHGRADVHILDTQFVRMDGAGLGAQGIALGAARLGVAFFRLDAGSGVPLGTQTSKRPARRFNLDLSDIGLGRGGRLRLTATFTRGHDEPAAGEAGSRGFALSLQHDLQLEGIGGAHRAWLQYAQGSAALDANFGAMTAAPTVGQWRWVESLTWQSGAFGGQAVALFGQHDADAAHGIPARYTERSLGARLSYAVTPHIKLLAEAGTMDKRPAGGERQRLTKFTFAPAWSLGPRWTDRPELRLYVTMARWNQAANAAVGAGGLTGLGDGATRGTSWGVQFETWF